MPLALCPAPPLLLPPQSAKFVTQDEESSGIISMDGLLSKNWKNCFMIAQQTHFRLNSNTTTLPRPEELVEGGQLLLMCTGARRCKY
jgi:hypothetical protein